MVGKLLIACCSVAGMPTNDLISSSPRKRIRSQQSHLISSTCPALLLPGEITRQQWQEGLQRVLDLRIPFLHFDSFLGLPSLGVYGAVGGPINYHAFLDRFRPVYAHPSHSSCDSDSGDDLDMLFRNASPPSVQGESRRQSGECQQMADQEGTWQKRKRLDSLDESRKEPQLLTDLCTLIFVHRYQLVRYGVCARRTSALPPTPRNTCARTIFVPNLAP